VLQPCKVLGVQRTSGGFVCSTRWDDDNVEFKTHAVIAAHGSWLPGPLATQIPKSAMSSDLMGFKAQFRDADLPSGYMPLVAFAGGYGGLVRADDGLTSFSLCIRRDALAACRARHGGAAGDAVLAHVFETCPAARDALGEARREGDWLAAGPIRPGLRPFDRDGIRVIGNAAAEAHPAIAEGIGMAMRSGALLADTLVAGSDYRRENVAGQLLVSRLLAALAMHPSASRLAAAMLRAAPSLLAPCARLSGKAAAP